MSCYGGRNPPVHPVEPLDLKLDPMITTQPPRLSTKPATVTDMIGWLAEQALHTGQMAYSTSWCPQEICTSTSGMFLSQTSFGTPISGEIDIDTALGHAINDWYRGQYLARVVRENGRLIEETTRVVHARLLAAGLQEGDLEMLTKCDIGLRIKIAKLQELYTQRFQPPAEQMFSVWLIKEEGTTLEKVKVFLPKRGTFAHFLAVFRDVWLARAYPTIELERKFRFGTGAWIYRLLDTQSQIDASIPQVRLVDAFGYRTMVKRAMKRDTELPAVVFWHVSSHPEEVSVRR